MKKFKVGRISPIIWFFAVLLTIIVILVFWTALAAFLDGSKKVVNDFAGMGVCIGILLLIWLPIVKRGKNEEIPLRLKQKENLAIPLEVKNTWLFLTMIGIFIALLGILLVVVGVSSSIGMIIIGSLLILLGIFILIQRLAAHGKVILRVDEHGITYSPMRLTEQRKVGPISWNEITDIGLKTIYSGRSSQTYLKVSVVDVTKYYTEGQRERYAEHPLYHRFMNFGMRLTNDENTAILAPVSMLKVNSYALERICQEEWFKHQENIVSTEKEEIHQAEPERSPIFENPIENSENHRKKRRKANVWTGLIVLVILIIGIFGFVSTQGKYAGLKNQTQYFVTTNEEQNQTIYFSFKIVDDARAKYPVVLFATALDENDEINQANIATLVKVQNEVIKGSKIYKLQQEGNHFGAYAKYKVTKNMLKLDFTDSAGNLIITDADYLELSQIKKAEHGNYFTAQLKFNDNQAAENVRIYTSQALEK